MVLNFGRLQCASLNSVRVYTVQCIDVKHVDLKNKRTVKNEFYEKIKHVKNVE